MNKNITEVTMEELKKPNPEALEKVILMITNLHKTEPSADFIESILSTEDSPE